jgi:hypothetical protein
MWKHVITETTFWKHSAAANKDREQNRGLDEEKQSKLWKEKFHNDLNVAKDVEIPGVFIDPSLPIFSDPCQRTDQIVPEPNEIEKFKENTLK